MNINIEYITRLKGHKGAIFALSKSANSHNFLSGGSDGWVVEWDINHPKEGKLLAQVPTNIFALHRISGKDIVIAGDMYGEVHWINLASPEKTRRFQHHKKGVFAILEIEDKIYTTGGDGILTQWSIEEERPLASIKISSESLRTVDYAPNRQEIAIGASDSHIYLLDSQTLKVKNVIKSAHQPSVFTVRYTPDEISLLSGGRDAQLRIWNLDTLQQAFNLQQAAHWYTINTIALHPSSPILATASRDKTIRIWNLADFKLLKVLDLQKYNGHTHSVNALLWSTHQDILISASDDRNIILWDTQINN